MSTHPGSLRQAVVCQNLASTFAGCIGLIYRNLIVCVCRLSGNPAQRPRSEPLVQANEQPVARFGAKSGARESTTSAIAA